MKLVINRYVFDRTNSYKILKAKYLDDGLEDMLNDYPEARKDEFLIEEWENIQPLSLKDVLLDKDLERRRAILEWIPVQRFLFENAKTVDVRTVTTANKKWDMDGKLISTEPLVNRYELLQLDAIDLFPELKSRAAHAYIYAVKVICPTTDNTFFIIVAGPNDNPPYAQKGKYNALEAIASMCFCPITNPKSLYRQGDVMIFEHNPDSKPCTPYALKGEDYVRLLQAQS